IALTTTDPAIDAQAAAALAERAAGRGAIASNTTLGVLPKGDGFVLAYENLVRSDWNIETIFINASSGAVETRYSRIRDQATIMSGTGVLRDAKKVSALQSAGGVFQAVDQLRPA